MSSAEQQETNQQNSAVFFNTKSEQPKKDIVKIIPCIIVSERIKCLGINLNKEVKSLHKANYKTLLKEIKGDINKWNGSPCSWIGRLNIKIIILPKVIYSFNAITVKFSMFFAEI